MSWATVAPSDHAGLLALYEGHFAQYEVSGDQRARCRAGLRLVLAWLQPMEGQSWQQAWDILRACGRLSLGKAGPRDLAALRDGLDRASTLAGKLGATGELPPGLVTQGNRVNV